MDLTPSAQARDQYATTTGNLTARMALHRYGTYPRRWFSWVGERLPAGGDVLEVGAGTGELWAHAGGVRRLTLADFSAAMCARLQAVPGARVVRCDAGGLPFRAGSFDTVVANHMLYHVDEPEAALREFARVLRPGGRLVAATNGRDHLAELFAIGPAIGRPDLMTGRGRGDFTAESGPAQVERHFTRVSVERYPGAIAVHAAEPLVAYLDSLTGVRLTTPQRAAVGDLVRASVVSGGAFHIRTHTVLIAGYSTYSGPAASYRP